MTFKVISKIYAPPSFDMLNFLIESEDDFNETTKDMIFEKNDMVTAFNDILLNDDV